MPTTTKSARGGFTLIELLIALVLLGIVGGVLARLMVNMQRGTRAQSQRVTLQGNLRAGMALIPSELRELSPPDLVTTLADRIEYRAMRTVSAACRITGTHVTLRDGLTFGYRPIVAGGRDRLFLFIDGDQVTGNDDIWRELQIRASAAGTCPDGAPATVLEVMLTDGTQPVVTAAGLVDSVFTEAPVRSFEQMEMRFYESDGRWWLGAHSVSGGDAIEPVLGPLRADDGLVFTYLDRLGNVTGTPADVRTLMVTLRGQTDGQIAVGQSQLSIGEDSLTTRIRLRNAPSF
jgi:prepilin-type N-terminal cleavage/methylation domain-containing protein